MKLLNLSPAQAITATGRGVDITLAPHRGAGVVVFSSKNSAGSSPTHSRKLQGSPGLTRGLEVTTAGATDNKLLSGATTANALAAQFTQSGARALKRVMLMLKKNGSIAAGKKLTLKLKTNNAGAPSSTILGTSGTVDIDTEVSTSYAWVAFTFAVPVDLADATVYHAELTCDYSADATNNVTWRSATVASGGNFEQMDNTTWSDTSTKNLEIYADQYEFTDISGVTQTQATAAVVVDEGVPVFIDQLPAVVSVYDTIGGTSTPTFYASCQLVADKTNALSV